MNSENKSLSHESETNPQDFEQLVSKINSAKVTVYEKLYATNMKAARDEFLANDNLAHPNNIYGNLDPEEVSHNLNTLDQVDNELQTGKFSNQQSRFASIIATDYRNANNFLAANIAYNTAETPEEKLAAAEFHHETNEIFYGKADEDVFYSLLSEKLAKIDTDKLSQEDQELYQQLLNDIGDIKPVSKERFVPRPETVEKFSGMVHLFFDDLLSHIPEDQDSFSPEEAASITNEILREEINVTGGVQMNHLPNTMPSSCLNALAHW